VHPWYDLALITKQVIETAQEKKSDENKNKMRTCRPCTEFLDLDMVFWLIGLDAPIIKTAF
jgi:hypothetical protein